ncbi:MAG: alanine racemase [Ignavibacteriaceae bacterium]
MITTSILELNKKALKNNITFIRKLIGKQVKISSVVKGNAYGHGIEQFVPMAEEAGIDHFSVFSADEAARVKDVLSDDSEIMIMGFIDNSDIRWAIDENIQYWVFDFDRLHHTFIEAKQAGKAAKIHIEIETGFNRTGFDENEIDDLLHLLSDHRDKFILEGICTHFAGAESIANYYRIQKQAKLFHKLLKKFHLNNLIPATIHSASSASAVSYPKTRMNMVRIGILQYGFWPSKETFINFLHKRVDKHDPLHRIISWKSKIMNVKSVRTGEFIGYGTSYLAQRDTKVAIVPVGYAQGFSRSLSNLGRALVKEQRVAVIGLVNMNHLIIDVTDVPDVKKNDEVVLIGKQGELSISVSSFSELSDQLNYESLTRLPGNIPRIIRN